MPGEVERNAHPRDTKIWRDLVAYWVLGLCNNYGYVVMLSAAHDIIGQFHAGNDTSEGVVEGRECHIVSTGAILLADILPSLSVKLLMPFLPFWVHFRIFSAILLSAGGFLLVAFAENEWMAILGVVVTSASSGIGESTFLSYSGNFNKNVISTWSSGTGGAGVVGSLSYASLRSLNISPRDTMLIMLLFPLIEAFAFWILLRNPKKLPSATTESINELVNDDEPPLVTLKEKFFYIKQLVKYMVPLGLVYFLEYFINQGLFELVYFKNSIIDKAAQYRWLNAVYQIGVFVSRSSVNVFQFNKIWIMSVLQAINVIYFLTEVIFFYTPSIWIVFAIVFWEGLLGGAGYVNTFYRMSKEIPQSKKEFAMAMVVQSDSYGIVLAGFMAIPVHNIICALPAAERMVVW